MSIDKLGPAGHGVDHAGFDLHRADGADDSAFLHRGKFPANFLHVLDQLRRGDERVFAHLHRRRAGVIGPACKDNLKRLGAAIEVTRPILFALASRIGPCSICSSR